MIDTVLHLVAASVNAGTVLALASLGLLVNERAGVVNLGAEGLMLVGALAAYATAVAGYGTFLAFVVGAGAAVVLALIFGWLVIWLGTNQYATGLALTLFGGGFAAFAGTSYTERQLPEGPAFSLFGFHPTVYLAWILGAALGWFLFRARAGLDLRGVGESPGAAHALGHPVLLVRLAAVAFGGALCGIAGAYVSVVYTRLWVEGLISGRGWIALALTTFATWRPLRVLLGAYLFGAVTMLQFHLQARGVPVDSHFLQMLPYLATVVVLVIISRDPAWIRLNMPASLGKPFRPDH